MVRSGTTNGCQNGTCLEKIGLHAQNMITTLGLIANIIGPGGRGLCNHFDEHEIFTLLWNKILIQAPQIKARSSYGHDSNHLVLIACLKS